jgi:hypothetical protein
MIEVDGIIVQYEDLRATLEVVRSDPDVLDPGAVVQVALDAETQIGWAAYEGTPPRDEGDIRPGDFVAATIRRSDSDPQHFIAESFAVGISP